MEPSFKIISNLIPWQWVQQRGLTFWPVFCTEQSGEADNAQNLLFNDAE